MVKVIKIRFGLIVKFLHVIPNNTDFLSPSENHLRRDNVCEIIVKLPLVLFL